MTLNPSRRKNWKILHVTTYPHNFGILIPCSSGVIWEQQTNGVMCSHVQIEGIFIPLQKPHDYNKQGEPDLLLQLQKANYNYKPIEVQKTWNKIKEAMHFDFEEIPNPYPTSYPNTQEGMMWIRITKFESGWGMGNWVHQFKGMKVILIYPNSD